MEYYTVKNYDPRRSKKVSCNGYVRLFFPISRVSVSGVGILKIGRRTPFLLPSYL